MLCRRPIFENIILPQGKNPHAGLWMDKFLRYQKISKEDANLNDQAIKAKEDLIDELTQIEIPRGYKKSFLRWRAEMMDDDTILLLRAKSKDKMAVGLGDRGSTEIGLSLHHTWGVPFIAGSALKGLTARAAHQLTDDEQWKMSGFGGDTEKKGPLHNELFGSNDEQGLVHFLDAWWDPTNQKTTLHRDILTSHHQEYYTKKSGPPSDRDNPTPISFVSTRGEFVIALQCIHADWREVAFVLLQKGLEVLGVGSKTNAGYGRMSLEKEEKTPEDKNRFIEKLSPMEQIIHFFTEDSNQSLWSNWKEWILEKENLTTEMKKLPKFSGISKECSAWIRIEKQVWIKELYLDRKHKQETRRKRAETILRLLEIDPNAEQSTKSLEHQGLTQKIEQEDIQIFGNKSVDEKILQKAHSRKKTAQKLNQELDKNLYTQESVIKIIDALQKFYPNKIEDWKRRFNIR